MIHFDIVTLEDNLKSLEEKTLENDFWNDTQNSSKVLKEITVLKQKVEVYKVNTQNSVIQ